MTLIIKTNEKCWHSPLAICDWCAGTLCSEGNWMFDLSLGSTVKKKNEGSLFHVDWLVLLYFL